MLQEALLLLSITDQCFEKLWIKTTKVATVYSVFI